MRCTASQCLKLVGADGSGLMAAAAADESVQSLPMLQLLVGQLSISLLAFAPMSPPPPLL